MKKTITKNEMAKMIDQTLLRAYVTDRELQSFCEECARYGFRMAAINSAPTAKCKKYLAGSDVLVGAAIGFPFGQTTVEVKEFEAEQAIRNGAGEIDYVVNLTELKSGNLAYVEDEMRRMTALCRRNHVISKVIFENCYLTYEEKIALCRIAKKVLPDYIKTSTGFGNPTADRPVGATVSDVRLMKSIVGDLVKVKAAGGIHDLHSALALIEAGAERIGTSSGVRIMEEMAVRGSVTVNITEPEAQE